MDDEPTVLAAHRRLLGRRFDVTVAAGGREAIALLERDRAFDAIICDVMMPDVDGPAVWSHLMIHHPELAKRTAFCTAGAFTPRAIAFTEALRERVILKPVEPERLASFVEEVAGLKPGPGSAG